MKILITRNRMFAAIVSIMLLLWVQYPRLFDEFQVDEDIRYFYKLNLLRDPSLYQINYLRPIISTREISIFGKDILLFLNDLGYGLVFFLGNYLVPPLILIKILPFIVFPVTALYLYEFGRRLKNENLGTFLSLSFILINMASASSVSIVPGLPRSFAVPIIIMLIYYLHTSNGFGAVSSTVLGALFYPPTFLLALTTWMFYLFRVDRHGGGFRLDIPKQSLKFLIMAVLLSALCLSPLIIERFSHLGISSTESLGNSDLTATLTDNINNFVPGGRYSLFTLYPLIGNGGITDNGWDAINFFWLLILAFFVLLVRGRRSLNLPFEVWCVLLASIFLFVGSWVSVLLTDSFLIYLPSRYSRVGISIFLSMFIGLNGPDFLRDCSLLLSKNQNRLKQGLLIIEFFLFLLIFLMPNRIIYAYGFDIRWLLIPLGLVLGILIIFYSRKKYLILEKNPITTAGSVRTLMSGAAITVVFFAWSFYAKHVSGSSFLNPTISERELLSFIERLPKDVLIAGSPCALDNVPFFAKRQILFSCELDSDNPQLIQTALNAYYSEKPEVIADFCFSYSVDYLVVKLESYSKEYLSRGWIFFEPYNSQILPKIRNREDFVLNRIPDTGKVFVNDHYFIVPCDEFINQNARN